MPQLTDQSVPVHTQGRPFPWFCPNCRRKEVRCETIPYQCQRFHDSQPLTVVLSALNVPKCANCGELVFTYDTERQIDLAYREQTEALRNGPSPKKGAQEPAGGT
jgi:hypothetical protein